MCARSAESGCKGELAQSQQVPERSQSSTEEIVSVEAELKQEKKGKNGLETKDWLLKKSLHSFYIGLRCLMIDWIKMFGEQGWCSGESARLPPMCPGFDSRTRRHMWAEFCWFSTLLREVFLRELWFSPLLKNQHLI